MAFNFFTHDDHERNEGPGKSNIYGARRSLEQSLEQILAVASPLHLALVFFWGAKEKEEHKSRGSW